MRITGWDKVREHFRLHESPGTCGRPVTNNSVSAIYFWDKSKVVKFWDRDQCEIEDYDFLPTSWEVE